MLFSQVTNMKYDNCPVKFAKLNSGIIYSIVDEPFNINFQDIYHKLHKENKNITSKEVEDYINTKYKDYMTMTSFPNVIRYQRFIESSNFEFGRISINDIEYEGYYCNEPYFPSYIGLHFPNINAGMRLTISYVFYSNKFRKIEHFKLYTYDPKQKLYIEDRRVYPRIKDSNLHTESFITTKDKPYILLSFFDDDDKSTKVIITNIEISLANRVRDDGNFDV